MPPPLNFAPLENASDALTRSAERYQKALEKVSNNGELTVSPAELQPLNQKLMQSERKLTSPDGLPGRPWFQHLIYAPGSIHWLWRQDDAGRPRSHRAEKLERGRPADCARRQCPAG